MLNTFLLATVLACTIVAESQPTDKSNAAFPTRLAGTWKSESNTSNRLGNKSGVIARCDFLAFTDSRSWNDMKSAFVDPKNVNAPLHIGGVTIDSGSEALFILRGRIGSYEIGTSPGGGGVEKVQWESLHLIEGTDANHDMLIVGQTIYRRQP